MRNLLKKLSSHVLLLLSLILFTCEKDSLIENKTLNDLQAKPSLRIYNLNTDSVFTTNSILKNKITNTFFNKGEANSVNKITSSYGFSIHEEYTRLVATDSYESYSFVVERDVPLLNVLENYVLTIFNNGDYIQMLVSYPEVLINGEVQYDLTNITAEYINDDALVFKNLCENFADNVVEWDDSAGECFPFPCGGATGNGQHMPENEDECRANGSDRPFTSCQGAWVVSDCASGSGVGVDSTNSNLTSSGSTTTTTNNDVDFIGITPLKLTAQQQLKNNLGINNLTPEIVSWIDDPANTFTVGSINQYLDDNTNEEGIISPEALDFILWEIEFEMIPENIPCANLTHDCIASIRTMIEGLRRFHANQEGNLMADYFESVIDDSASFQTVGDLQDFYETADAITEEFNWRFRQEIFNAFIEGGVVPILELALFEVGGTFAIKLLQKIPLPWVLLGTRLNNMVRKVGLLGVQGSSNSIRIVTTNGSPYSKALELFRSLTKNANSITIEYNGTRIANMGNGNIIRFRPASASSGNYPATIDLDFRAAGIWTQIRKVKFQ